MGQCGSTVATQAPTLGVTDGYVDYSGSGPFWTCDCTKAKKINFASAGMASQKETPEATFNSIADAAADRYPDVPWLKVERIDGAAPPLDKDGKAPPALPIDEWKTWTYSSARTEATSLARAFVKLGFQHFDTLNLWGFNSPEWLIATLAVNNCGGKVAGLYPTDTVETVAYKIIHSGGVIVMLEDKSKVTKVVEGLNTDGRASRVKAISSWGYNPDEKLEIKGCGVVALLGWSKLLSLAPESGPESGIVAARKKAVMPGHCTALIYTSGTTGMPKAVMIAHDSLSFESNVVLKGFKPSGLCLGTDRSLSYLPLSHIAGMLTDVVGPISMQAQSSDPNYSATVHFARAYDLKAGTIKDRLIAVKPTLFLGVPLVWEKIADKVRAIGAANTGAKKAIGDWAKETNLKYALKCQLGGTGEIPPGLSAAQFIMGKVKAGLGLEQMKVGVTGAAPIRQDTLEYYSSLGIQINEVYGMSECTGCTTMSTDQAHEWGSCGWELPGCEVRCFKVDPTDVNKKELVPEAPSLDCTDEKYMGELCYRGRHIMMGYMANPDLGPEHVTDINKKTAETIDNEGWLHSGDKGLITSRGMCKITGRYKELIIGDGGENIAPVPIEDVVKKTCDGINEVMMVGDKRKYNIALITLKAVGANGEVPGTDDLDAGAKRVNPAVTTISGAIGDQTWIAAVKAAVTAANNNTKVCINNAFKIQKFTILPSNFSEEKNQLTPTKKLKRSVVEKQYATLIERIYNESGDYIAYTPADAPAL